VGTAVGGCGVGAAQPNTAMAKTRTAS